jgi:hypothetical protein
MDRIVGEPVGIIAIRVTTGNREDALGEQIADPVRHTRRGARIGHRRGQRGQQTSRRSAALSKIAPPSELACGRSKVAISRRSARSGKRTVCAIVDLLNAIASVWGHAVYSTA